MSSKWGYVYTADWRIDAEQPEVKRHNADTLRSNRRATESEIPCPDR